PIARRDIDSAREARVEREKVVQQRERAFVENLYYGRTAWTRAHDDSPVGNRHGNATGEARSEIEAVQQHERVLVVNVDQPSAGSSAYDDPAVAHCHAGSWG